MSFLTN